MQSKQTCEVKKECFPPSLPFLAKIKVNNWDQRFTIFFLRESEIHKGCFDGVVVNAEERAVYPVGHFGTWSPMQFELLSPEVSVILKNDKIS